MITKGFPSVTEGKPFPVFGQFKVFAVEGLFSKSPSRGRRGQSPLPYPPLGRGAEPYFLKSNTADSISATSARFSSS